MLIADLRIVAGYDPRDGKLLWASTAITMQTAGTLIWEDDLVFSGGGFPEKGTACVRADGSGEIVWKNNQRIYEQSMLVQDGHVYAVNDSSIAFCWKSRTGEQLWRKRLRGPISASPILSDGRIYLSNELGTTWVYRVTPRQFELVAKNQLGTMAFATPTICGGQIFLRVGQASKTSCRSG